MGMYYYDRSGRAVSYNHVLDPNELDPVSKRRYLADKELEEKKDEEEDSPLESKIRTLIPRFSRKIDNPDDDNNR